MPSTFHSPKIVVCCLRQDAAVGKRVAKKLRESGADPWLVKSPQEVGDSWKNTVEDAVKLADAFVVCLRPGFDALAEGQEEVQAALRANRRNLLGPNLLIPFIVEPVEGDRPTNLQELIEAVNERCSSQLSLSAAEPGQKADETPEPVAASVAPSSEEAEKDADARLRKLLTELPVSGSPESSWRGKVKWLAPAALLASAVVAVWQWPGLLDSLSTSGSRGAPAQSAETGGVAPVSVPGKVAGPLGSSMASGGSALDSLSALRIQERPSPNQTAGRGGYKPEAIVIHTTDAGIEATELWQANPRSGTSMHYVLSRDGSVLLQVPEQNTAWHLGKTLPSSPWELFKPSVDPNLYTLGIDHESLGEEPWPEELYAASAKLIRDLSRRWGLTIDRKHIVGHREIAPFDIPVHRVNLTAQICPDPGVDLDRLVQLAAAGPIPAPAPKQEPEPEPGFTDWRGQVRARYNIKLRKGRPSTQVEVSDIRPAGSTLSYEGWVDNGESVSGNPFWYRDASGNYFWAGATSEPLPMKR